MESACEIITINENLSLHFFYIPKGYELKTIELSGHEIKKISRLKDLNRVKLLKHWKKDNGNLVSLFTKLLTEKGWDFVKFPDPTVFAAKLI